MSEARTGFYPAITREGQMHSNAFQVLAAMSMVSMVFAGIQDSKDRRNPKSPPDGQYWQATPSGVAFTPTEIVVTQPDQYGSVPVIRAFLFDHVNNLPPSRPTTESKATQWLLLIENQSTYDFERISFQPTWSDANGKPIVLSLPAGRNYLQSLPQGRHAWTLIEANAFDMAKFDKAKVRSDAITLCVVEVKAK